MNPVSYTHLDVYKRQALGRDQVILDTQFHMRPGDRFFYHLQRGIPLRLELGEAELASSRLRAVRRDTTEVINISLDAVDREVPKLLDDIQGNLLERARTFREQNTYQVNSFEAVSYTHLMNVGFDP